MKKLAMLFLAAALTLCPLFALAAQETINVYNWGDYIEPEVLDLFEQETGIKVNYATFSSNEEMYEKLSAVNGGDYDVVLASDYMLNTTREAGLMQPFDPAIVDN